MGRDLRDWIEYLLAVPGEKFDLSSIALHHPELSEAAGDIDMEPSFKWSGKLEGPDDIVENIVSTQKYDLTPQQVMPISGGTSMGIFLVCQALLEPGDEVICMTPGWQQVPAISRRMNLKLKEWELNPDNGWKPDLEQLAQLVTPDTKLVYMNFPHNPTGKTISREEMSKICDIVSKNGSYLVSDEINRGLEWSGDISPSATEFYERAVSAASMSKSFGATGIRYGWFATRDRIIYRKCYDMYYNSFLCNNHPSEIIARALLKPENYDRLMTKSRNLGKKNLELLSGMINGNSLWSWTPPEGSFSCFIKYDTGEPSWDLFTRMVSRKPVGVEFIPGSCFSDACEYHVRVGFGGLSDRLEKGVVELFEGAAEYLS